MHHMGLKRVGGAVGWWGGGGGNQIRHLDGMFIIIIIVFFVFSALKPLCNLVSWLDCDQSGGGEWGGRGGLGAQCM